MSKTQLALQAILWKIQLSQTLFNIEAMYGLELSTEPWKKYVASDYDTPEEYCLCCLVDCNPRGRYQRDASLCDLPIKAPRKKHVIYLEALQAAQKVLLKPKSEHAYGDRHVRINAASLLVEFLEWFGYTPDPALVEIANSE